MNRSALYSADLAFIHHAGFGDFAMNAAPGLLQLLRKGGVRGGTLVDLACGSGIWARAAQRAGFDVIGVDQSPAMIALAKRVARGAAFQIASLHDCPLPSCAAITIVGEGLNYLVPRRRSQSPGEFFARAFRALRAGGLLIFDAALLDGKPLAKRQTWRGGRGWFILHETTEQRSQRQWTRRITTFRKKGASWRRADETHVVRLFSRAAIVRSLHRAGFAVRTSRRYGAFPLPPRRMVFIARKKQAESARTE